MLQLFFGIIQKLCKQWDRGIVIDILHTCVIIHNMTIKYEDILSREHVLMNKRFTYVGVSFLLSRKIMQMKYKNLMVIMHWRMIWCVTSRLQVQQPMIMHSISMSMEPLIIFLIQNLLDFWCCLRFFGFVYLFCYHAFMCLYHKRILLTLFNCLSLLCTLIFMIKHIDIPKNVVTNLWRLSSRAWYPNMNQTQKRIVLLALFVLMLCGWYSKGCWTSKSTIILALEDYL
jgi:hypothetical protein